MFRALGPIGLLFVLLSLAVASHAQVDDKLITTPREPDIWTITDLETRLQTALEDPQLADETRATVTQVYQTAISQLAASDRFRSAATDFTANLTAAPTELDAIRKFLDTPLEQQIDEQLASLPTELSLPELESLVLSIETTTTAVRNERQRIEEIIQLARDRPAAIRERISTLRQRTVDLELMLRSMPTTLDETALAQAQRVQLETEHQRNLSETSMLEHELLGHDTRVQLLSLTLDRLRRELSIEEARRTDVQQQVAEGRRQEAAAAQAEATITRLDAVGRYPIIARTAQYNAELSKKLAYIADGRASFSEQLLDTKVLAEQLNHDFEIARQHIDITGLTETLSESLAGVRGDLPDLRHYRRELAKREPLLREIGLARLKISERRRNLSEFESLFEAAMTHSDEEFLPDSQLQRLHPYLEKLDESGDLEETLAEMRAFGLTADVRLEIRQSFSRLQNDQKQLLDTLDSVYAENLRMLGDLDFAQRQLLDKAEIFARFLDEHLLWTPSTSPINRKTFDNAAKALSYLASAANWRKVYEAFVREVQAVPGRAALAAFVVVVLVTMRRRLHRVLINLGARNRYPYTEGFGITLKALLITLLLTIIWPVLLGFVGKRLNVATDVDEFVNAIGVGLMQTAWFLLFFFGFRVLCCRGGVAVEQFKWAPNIVKLLRQNLRWLLLVTVPGILVTATLNAQSDHAHSDSLGRLMYILSMAALAIFFQRVLNFKTGLAAASIVRESPSWVIRLRYLWYPLLVGTPVGLLMLAASGYFYSTTVLTTAVYYSLWLLVAAKLIADLITRWLIVTQRRMEWTKLLTEHQEQHGDTHLPHAPEDEGLDFQTINEQTRRLLTATLFVSVVVALGFIWADVVPSITIFEDIVLWEHSTEMAGQQQIMPVTLTDVGLAVFIGVIILVAAGNFPGLLEIAILQRLPLDAGLRYAITSISQYLIVAIVIVIVINTVGVGWGEVQWLAAALTVGLGFGLQEIFANFVSGLIILFERPVRIGDTVTIEGLTGTVTRIRIRATTITDWDNKEIVVPNKTFITSQLTNWTLSDSIVRVVMQVGVAYGSDAGTAHRIMSEIAQSNVLVLEEPAPSVYFMGLGDSSLDFEVRVYVKDLGDWFPVVHKFHMDIIAALTESGIEIPFPQRDLHIRSAQNLKLD